MGVLAQAKNAEEISCSQWEGSACTQSALFFLSSKFLFGGGRVGAQREREGKISLGEGKEKNTGQHAK